MATNSSISSRGELINHFNAVRLRVTGVGNLAMSLLSFDDVVEAQLMDLPMQATTNIEPTRLCNFKQQRASLRISVNEINETFTISKILIFMKSTGTSYPG